MLLVKISIMYGMEEAAYLCGKDMVFLMVKKKVFFSCEVLLTFLHGTSKFSLPLMH